MNRKDRPFADTAKVRPGFGGWARWREEWDGFDLLSGLKNLREENFEFGIGNFRL
jgi:hypothetical protein